ncbi:hypothetical protein DM194_27800 (plasmid) [Azospirillum ramasamyi]|uniref:Uncharacterized protein n=2 Tax=Azospirillum ramasamyi TaxID=682998 RepID=A0A2U9SH20_9PROT|nr:hypothetical protein DM194_27800 [Azospirillum ramasamyi]
MNVGYAYLVLGAFTQADNRSTKASINALRTYVKMSPDRAKMALKAMQEAGLVARVNDKMSRLVPAHEVPGCEGAPPPPLTQVERMLFDRLVAGEREMRRGRCRRLRHNRPTVVADQLIAKGWARRLPDQTVEPIFYDAAEAAKPQWVWLPTSLVRGASGQKPLATLHKYGASAALHLLVRLHAAQDLLSDGGIHWNAMRWRYQKSKIDQRGKNTVWVFERPAFELDPRHPVFARTIKYLDAPETDEHGLRQQLMRWVEELHRMGFVEYVGHVVSAVSSDGEILHPCSARGGESQEQAVAVAARAAADALIKSDRRYGVYSRYGHTPLLVPLDRIMSKAELLDLVRLRHRPHTKLTAAWYARMRATCAEYMEMYTTLRPNHRVAIPSL